MVFTIEYRKSTGLETFTLKPPVLKPKTLQSRCPKPGHRKQSVFGDLWRGLCKRNAGGAPYIPSELLPAQTKPLKSSAALRGRRADSECNQSGIKRIQPGVFWKESVKGFPARICG